MVQLSTVPKQQTHLRVAKDMAFSLGLWFRTKDQGRQFGSPSLPIPADYQGIDITGDEVRLVIYNQPRYGAATVINEVATLVEPEQGYCRVDLQAADTALLVAGRTYFFSVGWLADEYAGVVVQGELECVGNGIDDWVGEVYSIDAPLNLGVELDERSHIHVVVDHLRAPDITVGTVTTLAYGDPAQAVFQGAYPHQVLNLGIPAGPGGDPPSLEIGDVEVGNNENDAEVELVPDGPGAYLMNFTLPRASAATAGGRVYLDSYPEVIGNDIVDDSLTIQAVLNSMEVFGGGTLELGRKTYFINAADLQIPDDVWVEGLSRDVSGFRLGAGRKIKVGVWGDGDRPGGLSKLFVDGNNVGAATGLVHFQSVMAQMLYCRVIDGPGHNVLLDAAQNAVIQGCYVTGAGGAALALKNGSGGYNFRDSHFTSSELCLKVFDDDGAANNAYPFGSAHLNFWGGIFEQYADGEMVADIRCGGAVVFWGTGFSVNNAVIMSGGAVVRVSNDDFVGIGTFVTFASCTFNGGDETYPGVVIDGNETVTFDGINYVQQHDPGFCVVTAGSPNIRVYGTFDEGDNVTALFAEDGGSLVSMYSPQHANLDFRLPAARPTVLSVRQEGDAGHRFFMDNKGKLNWNEGADFGISQSIQYNTTTDDLLHSSVQILGRLSLPSSAAIFANGAVNLDVKTASTFSIVLTGAGSANPVSFTNPTDGAVAFVRVYADAGQVLTWNANILWPGGEAGPTAPDAGMSLEVMAVYDFVLSKWVARYWSDDPALAPVYDPNHLHDAADVSDFNEAVDDRVNTLIVDGTGITKTYDDGAGTLTLDITGADFSGPHVVNYQLVAADAGKWITMSAAGALTLTVPADATVNFPIGTEIEVSTHGAGQITITPAGGVTINSRGARLKSNGQYAVFGLKKTAANQWLAYGDLVA